MDILLYNVGDPDQKTIVTYEATEVPPVNSIIDVSDGPELPKQYQVIRYRHRVQGGKLRIVYVGVEEVPSE